MDTYYLKYYLKFIAAENYDDSVIHTSTAYADILGYDAPPPVQPKKEKQRAWEPFTASAPIRSAL